MPASATPAEDVACEVRPSSGAAVDAHVAALLAMELAHHGHPEHATGVSA